MEVPKSWRLHGLIFGLRGGKTCDAESARSDEVSHNDFMSLSVAWFELTRQPAWCSFDYKVHEMVCKACEKDASEIDD